MQWDFEIRQGIHFVQASHQLDLHNHYDFTGIEYSVEQRTLKLKWSSACEDFEIGKPVALQIEFREVSEFRFLPRHPEQPFSEDDCLEHFGYWTTEEWADGMVFSDDKPEPSYLTAARFMSGAIVAVQAATAQATVTLKQSP